MNYFFLTDFLVGIAGFGVGVTASDGLKVGTAFYIGVGSVPPILAGAGKSAIGSPASACFV